MNNLLIDQQSEQQEQDNGGVLNNFLMPMTNQDLVHMTTLLDNRGSYLGRKTKWVFLVWLRNKFNAVRGNRIIQDCDTFNSMDYYPGNIGVRIIFSEFDPDTYETIDPILQFQFMARVKDGMIISVRLCKRTIERDQIERLTTSN